MLRYQANEGVLLRSRLLYYRVRSGSLALISARAHLTAGDRTGAMVRGLRATAPLRKGQQIFVMPPHLLLNLRMVRCARRSRREAWTSVRARPHHAPHGPSCRSGTTLCSGGYTTRPRRSRTVPRAPVGRRRCRRRRPSRDHPIFFCARGARTTAGQGARAATARARVRGVVGERGTLSPPVRRPAGLGGLALYLIREALNRTSFWRPYLCSLPKHVPLPVFYSPKCASRPPAPPLPSALSHMVLLQPLRPPAPPPPRLAPRRLPPRPGRGWSSGARREAVRGDGAGDGAVGGGGRGGCGGGGGGGRPLPAARRRADRGPARCAVSR